MASIESHHGARVFQSGEEAVLTRFRNTSTGALVVPIDTDDLPAGRSFDTPFLLTRPSEAADLPDAVREELDSIWDQSITQVVVSLAEEGADETETTAAMVGDRTAKTGVHALSKATALGLPRPKLWPMAGFATPSAPDGIASVVVDEPGSGYSAETTITVSGDGGGHGARFAPVISSSGSIESVGIVTPGYGYDGLLTFTITDPAGTGSGAELSGTIGGVLNPVLAEAIGIADRLRAFIYADGPDGTDQEAVQARQLIGSKRVGYCDPKALKSIDGVSYPRASSSIFAGVQARMDRERGAVYPGSNVVINGIQGTNRPIEYGEQANYLNFNRVNTIINRGAVDGAGGFRTWGVWTCSDQDIWQFINVVRVSDLVNESIEEAFLQFVGRPQTLGNLDLMVMAGNGALKVLEDVGFLLPGSQFWLPEGQTGELGAQGIVSFAMRYEVPAPIVDVRINAYRNVTIGYELLYSAVTGQVTLGQAI